MWAYIHSCLHSSSQVISSVLSLAQFLVQKVTPQSDGSSSKVKVKVRVNVHGIFSVSSASLVEVLKFEENEEPMETDQNAKEEEVIRKFYTRGDLARNSSKSTGWQGRNFVTELLRVCLHVSPYPSTYVFMQSLS